ncbi:hypothetical protein KAJ61_03155 [Candidatus Parcubacteria bacterium]|nr:hypothetical protein [Candidatus Parcubacteria bacterium]
MSTTRNLSVCFDVVKGDGVIALHNSVGKNLIFLGASVEASVQQGYKELAPILFVPPLNGKIGLIAIASKFRNDYYPFFLKIGWKDNEPYIFAQDKDEPWVPKADKLAQITNDGRALDVKIDGEWYTTNQLGTDKHILPVSAGNLICQYLISEGEESEKLAEEIRQMAVVRVEEESLGKLSIRLSEKLFKQKDDLKRLSAENSTRKEKIEKALGFLENSGFGNRKEAIQLVVETLS